MGEAGELIYAGLVCPRWPNDPSSVCSAVIGLLEDCGTAMASDADALASDVDLNLDFALKSVAFVPDKLESSFLLSVVPATVEDFGPAALVDRGHTGGEDDRAPIVALPRI